jgi:hypothetical protein
MLAEQAVQNAEKVEEAYGGFAQRASQFQSSSHPFHPFLLGFGQLTWIVEKKINLHEIQTSNQTRNHGPASRRRLPQKQQQQQQPMLNVKWLNVNMNIPTRNSSRQSPSWRTLTRAQSSTILPPPLMRSSSVHCLRHHHCLRRHRRARRRVGMTMAWRRRI